MRSYISVCTLLLASSGMIRLVIIFTASGVYGEYYETAWFISLADHTYGCYINLPIQ